MGIKRLQVELQSLSKNPTPGVVAVPLPSNIFEWHYIVAGPKDTPYQGFYHFFF